MTRRLPAVRPHEVIRALERAGFFVHHTTGSHRILKHRDRPRLRVTVPFHRSDVPRGTLRSIIKHAGLTEEEFVNLL